MLCSRHRHHESSTEVDYGCGSDTYKNPLYGCSVQERLAKSFHQAAGVGLPEIETFQCHLTDYRLVVLSLNPIYQIIYKGPISMIPTRKSFSSKWGEHYNGCHSISGNLDFSVEYEKGYGHDDMSHHPCRGNKCWACHQ